MKIGWCTLIPLFRQGSVHSGSGSWDDSGWVFCDELHVSSFPDSGIVSPLRLRWVKGVCVLRCNLPPALLAEWPGSFTRHCANTGVKQTPTESQHTKLTLEKKILSPFLPGFELATFRSRARCFNNRVSRLPMNDLSLLSLPCHAPLLPVLSHYLWQEKVIYLIIWPADILTQLQAGDLSYSNLSIQTPIKINDLSVSAGFKQYLIVKHWF